ncbi:hypothetical protein P4O66_014561, partial [Electrophorus voltai]
MQCGNKTTIKKCRCACARDIRLFETYTRVSSLESKRSLRFDGAVPWSLWRRRREGAVLSSHVLFLRRFVGCGRPKKTATQKKKEQVREPPASPSQALPQRPTRKTHAGPTANGPGTENSRHGKRPRVAEQASLRHGTFLPFDSSMNTKNRYSVQDALNIITGDDSEFEGCQVISDQDPEDPDYTPSSKDMENDESNIIPEEHNSTDEQMVSFRVGHSPIRQYVKGKSHPWGLKIWGRCTSSGILCDFTEHSGNRLASCQLEDKSLAKKGRGSVDSRVEKEDNIVIVRWYDSKSVTMISSYSAIEPQDKVRRWSKSQSIRG